MNNFFKVDELVSELQQAWLEYNSQQECSLSDAQFDALEEELRALQPDHAYFSYVAGAVAGDGKKSHEIPMLSVAKAKMREDVERWLNWLAFEWLELVVEPKVDGLSATCCYENGQLLYVATRGDGTTGQDISSIAPFLSSIPKKVTYSGRVEVRGELYLPKNTLYDTQGRPLRNNCVGLINRKEVGEALHYVHFVAYQLLGEDSVITEAASLTSLAKEGFQTFEPVVLSTIEELWDYYKQYLEQLRAQWVYETDGLIFVVNDRTLHEEVDARKVVDHHHHYVLALKPPAEAKSSVLRQIQWQISRQGNLIPVAIFDSIIVGGAVIERATLHNASTVEQMALELGDELLIERANDVIPCVKENLSATDGKKPIILLSHCPSCQSSLVRAGVHLKCLATNCPEVVIQSILYWVRRCEMNQVGEATIRALHSAGKITTVADLYRLTAGDFAEIEGFANKKIDNFLQEIVKNRQMSIHHFISLLGIPLLSTKSVIKLGVNSMAEFWAFHDVTYVIGQNLISWRDEPHNQALVEELTQTLIIDVVQKMGEDGLKKVCMTGKGPFGRKELIQMIQLRGYRVVEQISKETDLLLCDEPEGNSSKLIKAKKLGVNIRSYDDFF
jgi:DNA ligase (NAD+)